MRENINIASLNLKCRSVRKRLRVKRIECVVEAGTMVPNVR